MRQRISYIHKPDHEVNTAAIQVTDSSIQGKSFEALREDRLTFAVDELPVVFQDALKGSHELHIRWVTANPYTAFDPLSARLPPGLHVFYTPKPGGPPDL